MSGGASALFRGAGKAGGAATAAVREAGGARGEFGHDRLAGCRFHAAPGGDFLDRAHAADADPLGRVNRAQLDAGAVHFVPLPDFVAHVFVAHD